VEVDEERRLMAQAVDHFNAGRFFESHEFWEDLWHDEPPRDRDFVQGLIQVAAGLVHFQRENLRGAITLVERGAGRLERYPQRHRGVQVGQLAADARRLVGDLRLRQSGQIEVRQVRVPRVEYDPAAYRSGHT
jgi:predicted metal-dependent hydrolase